MVSSRLPLGRGSRNPMSAKTTILELLRDGNGGATNERLASLADISVRMVDYCLSDLESEGWIARRKTGRGRNQGREIVVCR